MALLLTLILIALVIAAFVWIIRYAKAQQQAKEDQLIRSGFRRDNSPQKRKELVDAWGSIETGIYARSHHGYTVWHLEQSDSEDSSPFLAVMFDQPVALPRDAWVLAAVVKEEGLAMKMLSGLAHLSGHKHRLQVPLQFTKRWWAWGKREIWMPHSPPDAFWEAINYAPYLSVHFASHGIKIDILPTPGTYKTSGGDLLTSKDTLAAIDNIAEAFLHHV